MGAIGTDFDAATSISTNRLIGSGVLGVALDGTTDQAYDIQDHVDIGRYCPPPPPPPPPKARPRYIWSQPVPAPHRPEPDPGSPDE